MRKITVVSIISLVLVGAVSGYLYHWHTQKQEDDVAYFALDQIHKSTNACYEGKDYYQAD